MQEIKIALINGINDINDGDLEKSYITEQEEYHAFILGEYVKKHYQNDFETKELQFNDPNSLALFLREKGKVVFLNSTSYINGKASKNGRSGIFIFPDKMSENQIVTLREFYNSLNYDNIQIWFAFTEHAQCQMIYSKSKSDIPGILDFSLEYMNSGKTK